MVSIFVLVGVLLFTYFNLTAKERNNNQEIELLVKEKETANEVNLVNNNSPMVVDIHRWADPDDKEGLSLKFCDYLTERPEEFYEIMKDNEEIYMEWVSNLGVNVFTSWNGETNRDEIRLRVIDSLSNIILEQPMDNWNRYLVSKLKKIRVITFEENEFDSEINWQKLYVAWQGYINYPSADNAKRVYQLLPNEKYTNRTNTNETRRKCIDNIYENINMLETQVISNDRAAVRLAFKLLTISDAAFTESLTSMLGEVISINPKMFLEELKKHNHLINRLSSVLGNTSDVYVDRLEAYLYEIQERIRAFDTVTDSELSDIRDQCINVLNGLFRRRPNEYYEPR